MPAIDVDRLRAQSRRFIDGFTPGQKAITLLGVVAVVLAGMTFMRWAGTPDYAPLYTGLDPEDAGAVVQQLDAQGVKYKLSGGGSTVLVPRPEVYKTRVNLSAKGLPSGGGDTFALLDKQGITTDQFTRNINYQRALQGELARTIQSIDNVQGATVNLTIPQDTVFVGAKEDKPTAAVLVKSSGTLPDSTVAAIVHLVASSIPNMDPDDVTVADADGKVLHAPGTDAAGGGSQIEQKQAFEAAVEKKIGDMIASTLGPGHAAVTVSAELDMSKSRSTTQTFQRPSVTGTTRATTDIPLEQNNTTETLTQNGPDGTGGQLGVGNPDSRTTVGGAGPTNYNKTTTQQRNALDSTQITAETPPGTVRRMSVSVLLDRAVVDAGSVTQTWIPQITAAAGILPNRDGANAVQVQSIDFNTEAIKAAQPTPPAGGPNAMFDLVKHVLTLAMIGLILFFAWKAIKRAEANRVPLRVPLDLRELEAPEYASVGAHVAGTPIGGANRRPLEPPPPTIEGELTDLIERQPDEVAQTLRSWLADRRG